MKAVVFIAIVFGCSGQAFSLAIVQQPDDQVVRPGENVRFSCQGTPSLGVVALVNGTYYQEGSLTSILGITISNRTLTSLTLTTVANSQNNMTQIQCYASDPLSSLWSYRSTLIVYGPPLAPSPVLLPVNSTTLTVAWREPFSWSGPARILYYTVRIFNPSTRDWTTRTVPSRANATNYTLTVAAPEHYAQNACTPLTFVVSATNAAGEGANGSVYGSVQRDLNPDDFPITAMVLLNQNGTPEVNIELMLPCVNVGDEIRYDLAIRRGTYEVFLARGQRHNGTAAFYAFKYYNAVMDDEYTTLLTAYAQGKEIETTTSFNTSFAVPCEAYLKDANPTFGLALGVGITASTTFLLAFGFVVILLIIKDQKRRLQRDIKKNPASATNPMTKNPIYETTIYDTIPGGDYDVTHFKLNGGVVRSDNNSSRYSSEPKAALGSDLTSQQCVQMTALAQNKMEVQNNRAEDSYVTMQPCPDNSTPKPLTVEGNKGQI